MSPQSNADIGRELGGRYRLVAPVGVGTSARVFMAVDTQLRRRVAVKLLHAALAADDTFLRRFRAEARAAAALSHPNIVAVYDWGEDVTEQGVQPYLVTEYLGGGSLRRILDRGRPLSPSQALIIGLDSARALDHAHRRGLIHRDVKPANLLFDKAGRLRLADFGLARALAEASWTEPTGTMLGTARYTSPEQATGRRLDGRSDVYSLALVLVECVTAQVPFAADTTAGTLALRTMGDLPVPASLGALRGTLERAGRLDPEQRPDAAEVEISLRAAAETMNRPDPLPLVETIDEAQVTAELRLVERIGGLGAVAVLSDASTGAGPQSSRTGTDGSSTALGDPAGDSSQTGDGSSDGDGGPDGSSHSGDGDGVVTTGSDVVGRDSESRVGASDASETDEVATGGAGAESTSGSSGTLASGSNVERAEIDGAEDDRAEIDSAEDDRAEIVDVRDGRVVRDERVVRNRADLSDGADAPDGGGAEVHQFDGSSRRIGSDGVSSGVSSDRGDAPDGVGIGSDEDEPFPLQRSPIVVAEEHHLLTASRPASFGRVEPFVANEGDQAVPDSDPDRSTTSTPRRSRRVPRSALAALVVLAALGGAALWWFLIRVPVHDVPDLVGTDVAAVTALAKANGWHLDDDTVVRVDATRAGQVVKQSPAAGKGLAEGETLKVTVSLGPTLVAVPNVVGKAQAEAVQAITDAGLVVGPVSQSHDESVAAGSVISAGPAPGQEAPAVDATVPRGTQLALVVSDGPAPRSVPDGLTGIPVADARAKLSSVQLAAQIQETYDEGVPAGVVISAGTPAGTEVARDTPIVLTVSKGPAPVPVPNVVGMSGTAASAQLQASGLGVSGIEGSPSNVVLATDPPAGETLPRGAPVRIFTRA